MVTNLPTHIPLVSMQQKFHMVFSRMFPSTSKKLSNARVIGNLDELYKKCKKLKKFKEKLKFTKKLNSASGKKKIIPV